MIDSLPVLSMPPPSCCWATFCETPELVSERVPRLRTPPPEFVAVFPTICSFWKETEPEVMYSPPPSTAELLSNVVADIVTLPPLSYSPPPHAEVVVGLVGGGIVALDGRRR